MRKILVWDPQHDREERRRYIKEALSADLLGSGVEVVAPDDDRIAPSDLMIFSIVMLHWRDRDTLKVSDVILRQHPACFAYSAGMRPADPPVLFVKEFDHHAPAWRIAIRMILEDRSIGERAREILTGESNARESALALFYASIAHSELNRFQELSSPYGGDGQDVEGHINTLKAEAALRKVHFDPTFNKQTLIAGEDLRRKLRVFLDD